MLRFMDLLIALTVTYAMLRRDRRRRMERII